MNLFPKIKFNKACRILLMIFLLGQTFILAAQKDTVSQEEAKVEVYSQVREELHRYMGYEELLPKYISLPYDVSMNTNIGNSFVDISYLFIMFLPILLLLGFKNKALKAITGLLMILFLIISVPNGFRAYFSLENDEIETQLEKTIAAQPFSSNPLINTKLQITKLANTMYQPLHKNIIERFSGEGDGITYPIFLFILCLSTFLLSSRLVQYSKGNKALVFFFLLYSFLWLILGSGVIWYGLLMLPLGVFFIGIGFFKNAFNNPILRNMALAFGGFWLIAALTYRFANYHLPLTQDELEKGAKQAAYNTSAIHGASLRYGLGLMGKEEIMDVLFPAYRPIVNQINNDPTAFVYRVGTYFQYFIDRNNERVLEDNQLAYFDQIQSLVDSDKRIADVLRGQGYKYMIIDFNVHTIDRTPDGTLTKKAKRFEEFLIKNATNNTNFEVIGTDRVIINNNGQQVFGLQGRQIVDKGTFIAFKINQ